MASSKFVFLFLAMFVAVQFVAASPRVRRDVQEEKPADPLASIQNFLKENLKFDKVIDNLKDLGEKVQAGTKEFAQTVQNKAQEIFKPAEASAAH